MDDAPRPTRANTPPSVRLGPIPDPTRDWHWATPWLVAGGLLLASLAALAIDCPVSRWCMQSCHADAKRALACCEPFGHGFGIILVLAAVHQLDVRNRWALWRLALVPLVAGLTADLFKLTLVDRIRPRHWNLDGTVWDTFGDWLPFNFLSTHQSFPSGHATAAFACATALAWRYPRARIYFYSLAAGVALQRVVSGAHYTSDVLAGAALGLAIGTLLTRGSRISAWFDRREAPHRVRQFRAADEEAA